MGPRHIELRSFARVKSCLLAFHPASPCVRQQFHLEPRTIIYVVNDMIEATSPATPLSTSFHQENRSLIPFIPDDTEDSAADCRILIVDDEAGVRELFASHLSEIFECTTAASADEALIELAARSYALVISDMMMPGRNGVELLREIRSRYPETAVIMISGVDRPQRVRDALRLGAADYLIKPCELDGVTLSVERALERRTLQRTARIYKSHLEGQNIELARRKSELERLQGQLVHTEKMASLGQLSAGIAHELNNPAGFVYGNMDLLQGSVSDLTRLFQAYDSVDLPEDAERLISSLKTQIGYERLMNDLSSIISDCREGAHRACEAYENNKNRQALASANQRLLLKLTEIKLGIVGSLTEMLRIRNEHAYAHALRVRNYSLSIAKAVGVSDEREEDLSIAALLHHLGGIHSSCNDVGSMRLSLLAQTHKAHFECERKLFHAIPELAGVVEIVSGQSENYDGSGSPKGLSAEQIPLLSRILRVADEYDQMVLPKASASMTHEEVMRFLTQRSEKQFDPFVLTVLSRFSPDELGQPARPIPSYGEHRRLRQGRFESPYL
jgi:response regulator RpfG family c-di-GMP phosphodiesterase